MIIYINIFDFSFFYYFRINFENHFLYDIKPLVSHLENLCHVTNQMNTYRNGHN